ncbi:hypothetical protein IDJ81_07155 [Tsuneonella flava]|uniref:Uncharacterized protein n=1 Tax=Tsuneonella flava TaxID=2055955 RepID=A0ABX7KD99_9SPHN|nr:hypothetical protein [Tsuneonella flava]QSB46251.1 hypothetical protein IDJ81_07155 [Tsuneonella flava]
MSLTIIPGLPRWAIGSVSSCTTRRPEIEVSGPDYGTIAWFGHMPIAAWIAVAMLCWRAPQLAQSNFRHYTVWAWIFGFKSIAPAAYRRRRYAPDR